MFENIKRLYDLEKLDKVGVRRAVEKKWITESQYKEITGDDY